MKIYNVISFLINTAVTIILIAIAVGDVKRRTINGKMLIALLLGSIAAVYASNELNIINSLCAMTAVFILLCFIYYISKKSMEWGDVLFCSFIAPYLGVERAFAMLLSSMLLCGLFALILLLINKKNKSLKIPFAPFVVLGTIAALIF